MTRQERAKLRHEMRRMIAGMLKDGGRVTTSQIHDQVMIELPDLVEEARARLFKKSLTDMARDILKETMRSKDKGDYIQVNLFGNSDPDMQVPKCIALPPEPGSTEMVWTPTLKATLSELRLHIQYLQTSAAADMKKAKKLAAFFERVMDLANTDDFDTPIEELLRGLQAKSA